MSSPPPGAYQAGQRTGTLLKLTTRLFSVAVRQLTPVTEATRASKSTLIIPKTSIQTVTGLIPGQTYTLSWAYGDRPGSGDEEMLVYFGSSVAGTSPGSDPGGTPVATDFDTQNGANPTLSWTFYSFNVTATSTSEVLSFVGLDYTGYQNNGGASYGNEIDDVSLVGASSIATPEPSTWLLLLSGLGLLGLVLARRRQALPPSPAISLQSHLEASASME